MAVWTPHTVDGVLYSPFVRIPDGRGTPLLLSVHFRARCGISRCPSAMLAVCLQVPFSLCLPLPVVAPAACERLRGLAIALEKELTADAATAAVEHPLLFAHWSKDQAFRFRDCTHGSGILR